MSSIVVEYFLACSASPSSPFAVELELLGDGAEPAPQPRLSVYFGPANYAFLRKSAQPRSCVASGCSLAFQIDALEILAAIWRELQRVGRCAAGLGIPELLREVVEDVREARC